MYRLINSVFALAVVVFALTASAARGNEVGERALAKADSLYALQQYEAAVKFYKVAADSGVVAAEFDLGYAYYNGEGITRDFTQAAKWFKRAAAKNFAKAQFNLAYCYMNGRGVPRNYDKALELLTKSAENNYVLAQSTLADCYDKGILVEQDEAEGKKWRQRAENPEAKQTTEPEKKEEPKGNVAPKSEPKQELTPKSEPKQVLTPKDSPKEVDAPKEEPKSGGEEVISPHGEITLDLSDGKQGAETKVVKPEVKPVADSVSVQGRVIRPKNALPENTQPSENSMPTENVQPKVSAQPPVLKILYPEDQSMFHTTSMKVKYQLIAPGMEDKTKVTVMIDGQRVPADRAVRAANTVDIDLPQHDCVVMMYAQNEYGNSEPSMIRLIKENTTMELPRLFVVAVGVGEYDDPQLPKLRYTCKDAKDFSDVISSKKDRPYEEVQVKTLLDQEATRSEIFEAMEWLKQESSPNDICVFFFAGHGFRDEKDRFYFMPYGAHPDKLYDCFSATDFRNAAEEINGKFIVFADACYSGALLDGARSAATMHFVEQLRRTKNGMILYASSTSDTKSKEDETWGNGAFTKALVEAFNGAAKEEGSEGLSTQDLERYLYKSVRKTTNFKQTPIFINPSGMEHFNLFLYGN